MKYCCVSGCKDKKSKRHSISVRPNICQIWLKRINNKKLLKYDKSGLSSFKICDIHFEEVCKLPNGKLKASALPTLHLPGFIKGEDDCLLKSPTKPATYTMPEKMKKFWSTSTTVTSKSPIGPMKNVTKTYSRRAVFPSALPSTSTYEFIPKEEQDPLAPEIALDSLPVLEDNVTGRTFNMPRHKRCFICGNVANSVSLHKFPSDIYTRSLWLQACGLSKTDNVKYIKLCSAHFKPNDYIDLNARECGGCMKLKINVAPTLKLRPSDSLDTEEETHEFVTCEPGPSTFTAIEELQNKVPLSSEEINNVFDVEYDVKMVGQNEVAVSNADNPSLLLSGERPKLVKTYQRTRSFATPRSVHQEQNEVIPVDDESFTEDNIEIEENPLVDIEHDEEDGASSSYDIEEESETPPPTTLEEAKLEVAILQKRLLEMELKHKLQEKKHKSEMYSLEKQYMLLKIKLLQMHMERAKQEYFKQTFI